MAEVNPSRPFYGGEIITDEDLHKTAKKEIAQTKAERDSKILDAMGIDEEARRSYFDEPEEELSPEEIARQRELKLQDYRQEAETCLKKLLPEYPGLAQDDPRLEVVGIKLHAQNPNLTPIELARKTCDALYSYKGLIPLSQQKRNQDYVNWFAAREEKVKRGPKAFQENPEGAKEEVRRFTRSVSYFR